MSPELISKELKRVQAINQKIFDSSPNFIFTKSVEGVYQMVNKAMCEFLGVDEVDLIGRTDANIADDKAMAEIYKREDELVFSTGESLEIKPVLNVVKGIDRFFQTVKSPLFNEKGEVTGLLGIVTEVTELIESEKKVREQEKLLNIVFNSGTDFIAVLKPVKDGFEYVSCNSPYIELLKTFGIEVDSEKELVGLKFNSVTSEVPIKDPERISEIYGYFEQVIESKELVSTTDIVKVPGTKQNIYIDVEISPILGDAEGVDYLIYRGRDFSEIMSYNLQLQEREELLQSINRNVHDGIYRSTIGKGLRYSNDSMCRMFGYTYSELSAVKPAKLYATPKDREDIIEELSTKGFFSDKEVLFKRKDGSTFWGLLSCSMSLDADRTKVIDGIIVDVTEKRKAREELRSMNENLRKTNSELDHLVYRTSHDLRSPLVSVMGLMELIRLEGVEGALAEYISIMEDQVVKLDKVILDIINIRKIARTGLQREVVDCKLIIDNIFESIKFLDRFNSIEKRITVSNGIPLIQDKNNIRIILNNVLSNAVKYAQKNIDDSYISIDIDINRESCSIKVKDNGIGIRENSMEKVFDMFYRATDVNQGTGLGLFIVKEAVNKLNGTIEMESKEGEWTYFSIEIPNLIDSPLIVQS